MAPNWLSRTKAHHSDNLSILILEIPDCVTRISPSIQYTIIYGRVFWHFYANAKPWGFLFCLRQRNTLMRRAPKQGEIPCTATLFKDRFPIVRTP